ncbi:lycopene cyclase domain-containing protein [Microbacterium fluvii]|uniref:Lycopene cyclase domain-containing protein n=1 Tax=Microbacterium fluvii TaxID=415215 RepID=A0ABW2HFP3_9MICO|nr:lycopene cyclase domain-containing protein [Microbacterium fluvii]MCU4672227.1 lycopene cyclase domain-containing protein [Microbacterium fluvii]
MTYAVLSAVLLLVAAAVAAASARRPRFAHRMACSAAAAAVLCILTAVFDNLMIAADLYRYPAEHLSGWRIGLAPLEDFAYPICVAFLVPSVWVLTERRAA